MRAFVAIELPPAVQGELRRQQAAFRAVAPEARWTRPEGVHITLKFLGEIDGGRVEKVVDTLAALGPLAEFWIEVRDFGFFPDARRPRVFWAGVHAPADLTALAGRVEGAMGDLGFAREERAFTPHLTLARFKIPRPQPDLAALVETQRHLSLGRFQVSGFFLFESRLSPQGAEYRKVAGFPMEGVENRE
ncbi:MAG TPA: RNA 2',3'-cyclic phosphodiesterase [Terriglobia bacterium]|nr:RNA 2',3'-cyclic phosphodiesterase [Terriglobia bacterium]